MKKDKGKHGGKRKGAGRKRKYDEPTKPMRIPMSLVSHVGILIYQRSHEHKNKEREH